MIEGKEFRIALLGTGAIAQVVHLPLLSQLKGVKLETICDIDHPKAAALANRFGIPKVERKDEQVFADPDIDCVIICTPSHLHESQVIAALQSGKHVLVEKPLALSAEAAGRVLEVAEKTDRALMVALNNRYRPDALALKPFATGGELGDVFFIKAGWLNRKVRIVRPTWRHRRASAGGGALMDLGLQILDLALWMLDFPQFTRVLAQLHQGEGIEVEDSAAVIFTNDAGLTLSLEVTWNNFGQRDRHYLQLLGTRGAASLSPLAVFKEIEHGLLDLSPAAPPGQGNPYTASYKQQLRHFLEVASGERERELPYDQVQLMQLIALAYQSAAESREVRL
jgi:predicted dehydrogenase